MLFEDERCKYTHEELVKMDIEKQFKEGQPPVCVGSTGEFVLFPDGGRQYLEKPFQQMTRAERDEFFAAAIEKWNSK